MDCRVREKEFERGPRADHKIVLWDLFRGYYERQFLTFKAGN